MILNIFQNFRKFSKKSKIFEFKIGVRAQHETSVLLTIFNENLCKRNFNTIYRIWNTHFKEASQTNDKNIRKNVKCYANVKANLKLSFH